MPDAAAIRSMPSAAATASTARSAAAEIEPAVAAEKIFRVEIAEHEIGVGHGGAGTALAVTGRSRQRPGAFRPDMQDAAGIDPRDRAAAGADARNVQAVQRDAVAADFAVHDQRRLAVRHQADIGRGAAHVERDQVLYPDQAGGMDAAGDPAGRSRQHGPRRQPSGLGDRRDAAMRLDDQGRPLIAGLGEPGFEPRQIARQHRADIGVDNRRRDPLELLDLRQDLAGQRDIGVGQRAI